MRARGAKVTDIVVLVVAADDGVMPQTVEAIRPRQGGGGADHRRHQQDRQARRQPRPGHAGAVRARAGPEDWGGDTICRRGVGQEADRTSTSCWKRSCCRPRCWSSRPTRSARPRAPCIEAKLDKGRGPVATVLVQKGTLKVGDTVVVGSAWGRVRALYDERATRSRRPGPRPGRGAWSRRRAEPATISWPWRTRQARRSPSTAPDQAA